MSKLRIGGAVAQTAAAFAVAVMSFALLTGQTTCIGSSVTAHPPGFDPLELARTRTQVDNPEAVIPSQCYTKTDGISNPCYTCHTRLNGLNEMNDYDLQREYAFSDEGLRNHWTNLFEDRGDAIAAISDEEILAYIRQDNYRALREHLEEREGYLGWVPDIENLASAREVAFDAEGFARDGSWWRAFRYKPFLGTFWPTNGSTDDVMIRHPLFYLDDEGNPNREIYKVNLAILEAAVATPSTRPRDALNREVEPIDETLAGFDFDGDGLLETRATRIQRLPSHYVGAASGIAVQRFLYPEGTEFLHTVRYVDPGLRDLNAMRMKEVRYARRDRPMSLDLLQRVYQAEDAAKEQGLLPVFSGTAETGLLNDFGWRYQGFIEAAGGHLRLQTQEETVFCMGCHSTIGVTVDQSFAFPRKMPGLDGWGYQDLTGIKDVPQAGHGTPEILEYFQRVRGADEFRANEEAIERFFIDGEVDEAEVRRAAPGGDRDILHLVAPSRERAIALNKAYKALVDEQDFEFGRDPVSDPATRVFQQISGNGTTALGDAGLVFRDGRIWLDWE
ncbi:MAG: hypothetical protein JRE81_07430 [Deltaproteobacteria bacterium]|jgi:hypothetical protein|nr:hypothetical protein [Deltaproteobacteria bacterium]